MSVPEITNAFLLQVVNEIKEAKEKNVDLETLTNFIYIQKKLKDFNEKANEELQITKETMSSYYKEIILLEATLEGIPYVLESLINMGASYFPKTEEVEKSLFLTEAKEFLKEYLGQIVF